jgi:uncharacterized membrane protein
MKTDYNMADLHFLRPLFLAGAAILVASMFAYWVLFKTENEASGTYRKGQILFGLTVLVLHGILTRGVLPIGAFMLVCLSVGTTVEILGVKKGWIFGRYRYSASMGPKVFGSLPAAVPLMWFAICYLGGSMAELLVSGIHLSTAALPFARTAAASGIVALFDAVIDPIAVAEKRWIWEKPGRYHGVPLSNFAGWFATSVVIFTLLNPFFYECPARRGVPGWIVFLPAFGHCLFLALCAKVCMERNLKTAGVAGWVTSVLLLLMGIAAFLK